MMAKKQHVVSRSSSEAEEEYVPDLEKEPSHMNERNGPIVESAENAESSSSWDNFEQ